MDEALFAALASEIEAQLGPVLAFDRAPDGLRGGITVKLTYAQLLGGGKTVVAVNDLNRAVQVLAQRDGGREPMLLDGVFQVLHLLLGLGREAMDDQWRVALDQEVRRFEIRRWNCDRDARHVSGKPTAVFCANLLSCLYAHTVYLFIVY